MADNTYISLKVCGRPHSNSGYQPLASFNSPLFDVPDTVYGGFDKVQYFFSIKIENNQVVYTLILNNVRSFQSIREGNLKIAISVPKGYKISNGWTPYDALIGLKDSFVSSSMVCRDAVRGVYEFNSGIINPNILDEAAKEYPLEEVHGPYRPMTVGGPTGYLVLREELIKQLLKDVQYEEFSTYKEVLVATDVLATTYSPITNIQVPRVSRFRKIVDGRICGYVDDCSTKIIVRGEKDPKCFNNLQSEFSINDLRRGEIISCATLNEEKEEVVISTAKLSDPKKATVNIVFDRDPDYFKRNSNYFKLKYKQSDIAVKDYSFVLSGEDIVALENSFGWLPLFTLTDKYIIKNRGGLTITHKGNYVYEFMICTEPVTMRQPARPASMQTSASSHTSSGSEAVVQLIITAENQEPNNEWVEICNSNIKSKIYAARVKFEWENRNRSKKGVMYIPRSLATNLNVCSVRFETNTSKYTASIFSQKDGTYSADLDVKKKSFYQTSIKPQKAFYMFVLGLILGLLTGIAVWYFYAPSSSKGPHTCDVHCEKEFDTQDGLVKHLKDEVKKLKDESKKLRDESKKSKEEVEKLKKDAKKDAKKNAKKNASTPTKTQGKQAAPPAATPQTQQTPSSGRPLNDRG